MMGNAKVRFTFICVLILQLSATNQHLSADSSSNQKLSERIKSTPDFPQIQKELPGNGSQYCAPVSASNGLACLAKHGYPKLMPKDQLTLAKMLGSPTFMNTSEKDGTGATSLIRGLLKYVQSCGYTGQVTYQGWRSVDRRLARIIPGHAHALQIQKGLQGSTLALLNIGWYAKEGTNYRRLGGHWVTLVGGETGKDESIIIHDPSGRSPKGQHERVSVTQIRRGTLTGKNKGLPMTAVRAWELGGELKINKRNGANTSVLDGAVLLKIK